jgi:tetratricopeptide (TPR) repeat protein
MSGWAVLPKKIPKWSITLLFILTVTAAGLYTCVTFDFVSLDDNVNVFGNPWLKRPLAEALVRFWRGPYESLYIPVPYTLWRLVAEGTAALYQNGLLSSPLPPAIFHGLSLALHLFNSALVIGILSRLIPGLWSPVILGATIFALHPIQMETVAWISGLRDLVAYGLGLSAIWLLMEQNSSKKRIALASVFFLLAILSKPNAVVLPMAAALIWYAAGCLSGRWRWVLLGVWGLCLIPVVAINKSQQLDGGLQFVPSLWQRPWIAWDAIGSYLSHIIWPFHLTPDYGRSPAYVLAQPWTVVGVLTPLVPLFIWLGLGQKKSLLFAYLFFLLCLGPTLGMISFQYQEFSTVSDRYAYLAMLGVGWFAAVLLGELRWHPVRWGLLLSVFLACSVLGRQQMGIWKDSRTLFSYGLRISPRSKIIAFSMGNLHYEAGRYEEAEHFFKIVADEWPSLADVHLNLAVVYAASQRFDLALGEVEKTLKLSPEEGQALHLKGMVLSHLGRTQEAKAAFASHLTLRPSGVIGIYSQAMTLLLDGDLTGAIDGFHKVLTEQPSNRSAMNYLAAIYRQLAAMDQAKGLSDEALKHGQKADLWEQRMGAVSVK